MTIILMDPKTPDQQVQDTIAISKRVLGIAPRAPNSVVQKFLPAISDYLAGNTETSPQASKPLPDDMAERWANINNFDNKQSALTTLPNPIQELALKQALDTGKPIPKEYQTSNLNPYQYGIGVGYNLLTSPVRGVLGIADTIGNFVEGDQQTRDEMAGDVASLGFGYGGGPILMRGKGPIDRTVTPIFGTRVADPEAITAAKTMQQKGFSAPDIWKETGVWEYRPNKWISETDDSALSFDSKKFTIQPEHILVADPKTPKGWSFIESGQRKTFQGDLGEIMSDGDVFQQYPALKKIPVDITVIENSGNNLREGSLNYDKVNGEYRIKVVADNEDQARAVIIHEMQHYVQEADNLPGGGNPRSPHNKDLWESKMADDHAQLQLDMHSSADAANMSPEARKAATDYINLVSTKRKPNQKKLEQLRNKFINEMPDDVKVDFFNDESVLTNNINEKYPGGRAVYDRLSGEVMARLAASRSQLDAGSRGDVSPMYNARNPFGLKEDVRPDLQIDDLTRIGDNYASVEITDDLRNKLAGIFDRRGTWDGTKRSPGIEMPSTVKTWTDVETAVKPNAVKSAPVEKSQRTFDVSSKNQLKGWHDPLQEDNFTIKENPSKRDMQKMIASIKTESPLHGTKYLRFLTDRDGNMFVWPAERAIHEEIQSILKNKHNVDTDFIGRGYLSPDGKGGFKQGEGTLWDE